MDLSPDGERLASADEDRVMRVWAVDSGKQIRSWSCGLGRAVIVRFAPDGRRVAGGGRGFEARIWDAETGKLLGRCCGDFLARLERSFAKTHPGKFERAKTVRWLAFLSSGRLLIGGERPSEYAIVRRGESPLDPAPEGRAVCWDTDTGSIPDDCLVRPGLFLAGAVPPDGRLLACGQGGTSRSGKRTWFDVSVHDLARNKCLLDLHQQSGPVTAVAFALGGTALAFVSGSELRLRDLKSGTDLCRRRLGDSVQGATFSPDGSRLAFIRRDGQVVLCGLEPPGLCLPPVPLRTAQLRQLWADLAAADPRVAYRAVYLLPASGNEGNRFLARHLRPVPPDLALRIQRLIADLDHEEFSRREAAQQELGRLGSLAETTLRRALAARPSLEARTRMIRLLDALPNALAPDRDTLQDLRAISVLQRIASHDAQALLQRLAAGASEARQTQAAKAALRCLRGTAVRK
jgi:hypothetical protein